MDRTSATETGVVRGSYQHVLPQDPYCLSIGSVEPEEVIMVWCRSFLVYFNACWQNCMNCSGAVDPEKFRRLKGSSFSAVKWGNFWQGSAQVSQLVILRKHCWILCRALISLHWGNCLLYATDIITNLFKYLMHCSLVQYSKGFEHAFTPLLDSGIFWSFREPSEYFLNIVVARTKESFGRDDMK